MIASPLCGLLGIEYPLFQGGMAWIADSGLAAAVSEAGGLGVIAAGNAPAAQLREQIRLAKCLTKKPFGVNLMLLSPYAAEAAAVIAEERVAVVTTGAGNPAKYLPQWQAAGVRVIPVVASVAMARLMARSGASAVIAEGGESGGHVGDLTTMALVPQVCDAVDLPVIAAGGIADGRGVAAALLLGACGVQLGTRFLLAAECGVHANYKQRVQKAGDIDTMVTGRRLGHPVRSLRSPFSLAYARAEADPAVSDEQLEAMAAGSLRLAACEGDLQNGCFLAGQCAALVKREQPAAEIIREIFAEAETLLKGANQWVK